MMDRSRKRRKPVKPNKHSPTQAELLTAKNSALDEPLDLASTSTSTTTPTKPIHTQMNSVKTSSKDPGCIKCPKFSPGRASPTDSCSSLDALSSNSGTDVLDASIKSADSVSELSRFVGGGQATQTRLETASPGNPRAGSTLSGFGCPSSACGQNDAPERSILTQYEELKSKAMTSRARRIIANARERNRVHTISAAFEELRGSIPCYSSNQKLSKLAILKIATSYIRCLGHVAGARHLNDGKDSSLTELVINCSVNVLSDGKLKKDSLSGAEDNEVDIM